MKPTTIRINNPPDQIVFNVPFEAVCSVGKLPFYGQARVVYEPDTEIIEFVSYKEISECYEGGTS